MADELLRRLGVGQGPDAAFSDDEEVSENASPLTPEQEMLSTVRRVQLKIQKAKLRISPSLGISRSQATGGDDDGRDVLGSVGKKRPALFSLETDLYSPPCKKKYHAKLQAILDEDKERERNEEIRDAERRFVDLYNEILDLKKRVKEVESDSAELRRIKDETFQYIEFYQQSIKKINDRNVERERLLELEKQRLLKQIESMKDEGLSSDEKVAALNSQISCTLEELLQQKRTTNSFRDENDTLKKRVFDLNHQLQFLTSSQTTQDESIARLKEKIEELELYKRSNTVEMIETLKLEAQLRQEENDRITQKMAEINRKLIDLEDLQLEAKEFSSLKDGLVDLFPTHFYRPFRFNSEQIISILSSHFHTIAEPLSLCKEKLKGLEDDLSAEKETNQRLTRRVSEMEEAGMRHQGTITQLEEEKTALHARLEEERRASGLLRSKIEQTVSESGQQIQSLKEEQQQEQQRAKRSHDMEVAALKNEVMQARRSNDELNSRLLRLETSHNSDVLTLRAEIAALKKDKEESEQQTTRTVAGLKKEIEETRQQSSIDLEHLQFFKTLFSADVSISDSPSSSSSSDQTMIRSPSIPPQSKTHSLVCHQVLSDNF